MSEPAQVIIDTSQAKRGLEELNSLIHRLDKSFDGVSAGRLIGEYEKIRASAQRIDQQVREVDNAFITSDRSAQKYSNTLGAAQGRMLETARALGALDKKLDDLNKSYATTPKLLSGMATAEERLVANLKQQEVAVARAKAEWSAYATTVAAEMQKASAAQNLMDDKRLTSALQSIRQKQVAEQAYTQWWATELVKRDAAEKAFVSQAAGALIAQEAALKLSDDRRLVAAMGAVRKRQADERAYTQWWASELSKREDAEKAAILHAVETLKAQEAAQRALDERRLASALQAVQRQRNAEREYTQWWIAELAKREAAERAMFDRNAAAARAGNAASAGRSSSATGYVAGLSIGAGAAAVAPPTSTQALESAAKRTAAAMNEVDDAFERVNTRTRDGARHAQGFTDSQHAMHSALRGVSGAMGALWLTYAKYIDVMIAATAATVAANKAFREGAELSYQARFAAILSNDGPAQAGEPERIRRELLAVTEGTKFNALEAAEALRVLAQTGVDAQDGLGMLNTIMAATIFGETDMKTATEGATAAMYNFGLMTDNATQNAANISKVGDSMAYVSVQTKAGLGDVAESFKTMTGLAQSYGLEIEEAMILLESVGKRGITGGSAGTLLRNMTEDLLGAPNNRKAVEIKDQMGIGMFVKGRDNPLEFMDQVLAKYRELDEAQKQQFDANVLNERGRRVFRILADDVGLLTDKLGTATEKSQGLLDRLVKGLEGDVKTAFQVAMSSLENALMSAFEGNEEALLSLARTLEETFRSEGFRQGLSTFIRLLSDAAGWIAENTELIKNLAIAYGLFKIGGAFGSALSGLTKAGDLIGKMGSTAITAASGAHTLSQAVGGLSTTISRSPILMRLLGFTVAGLAFGVHQGVNALQEANREFKRSDEGKRSRVAELEKEIELQKRLKDGTASFSERNLSAGTLGVTTQQQREREVALLKAQLEANDFKDTSASEIARIAARSKVNVVQREVGEPPTEGKPFNLGGDGSGKGRVDRSALFDTRDVRKLAEAEYQQAIDSVEFYKKGLDLRRDAVMVGEQEYNDILDALADKEIELGVKREQRVQSEIQAALGKKQDDSVRKSLESELETSLQKQASLETKAYTDKALRQLRDEADRRKFLEVVAKLEADSFVQRLTAQEQFLADWAANSQKYVDRALIDGDMDSFISLLDTKERGREDARKTDTADLASMAPENTGLQLRAMGDRHADERDLMLRLTQEDVTLRHQLEKDMESRHADEMLQIHVNAAQARLDLGTGGWDDMMLASLARVQEGFTTFEAGTTDLMANFFDSFTDGFANSVGRAIVYGDDLNEAMGNVAREGLASLISGLVKLGVQWLVNATIGNSIQATSAATSTAITVAQATAAAAAWAPAAALASLASFGSNSAPAMAGMAATSTLAASIAAASYAGAFDKGGMIPSGKWGIVGEYGPEIVQGPASVTSRQKTAELMGGGGRNNEPAAPAPTPVVNVRNINVLDPSVVADYLGTDDGEQMIMNVVQRNRSAMA